MKYIRLTGRLLLGCVFIFSGFVKAVDPLGSAYKFSDYFHAFHLGFLDGLSLPLSIFLSSFELVLGLTLILGYRRRIVYEVLFWFTSFFTLLTFILALFNPVTDCGCFGDALILTNWQTFLKNVFLMVIVTLLFVNRRKEAQPEKHWNEWAGIGIFFILSVGFSVWNHRHLPLLDFRPYDTGTVIPEEMEIPEGAAVDEYETTLIYRNLETGETDEFTLENYPRDTALWEFMDSESRLVNKGYEPPIHDFAIMDPYGNEITDLILSDEGYSLLMVAHNLDRSDPASLAEAGEWSRLQILAADFSFYAVTSSPSSEVESLSAELGLEYAFHAADEIMLKTMIRSNPGFVLLKEGVILAKWGFRDLPGISTLVPNWEELISGAMEPMDEEAGMLMEAGVYEDFSFNVLEFGDLVPALYLEEAARQRERGVIVGFLFSIALLVLLCQYVSPIKL